MPTADVDVCTWNTAKYKLLSKAGFVLSLTLGVVIIVLTVFETRINVERAPMCAPRWRLNNSDAVGEVLCELTMS